MKQGHVDEMWSLRGDRDSSDANVVVLIDADNTLWDTNAVYVAARRCLLDEVRSALGKRVCVQVRKRDLHAIDETIYRLHKSRYLYPPHFLARAVALLLMGDEIEIAARKSLHRLRVVSAVISEKAIARRYKQRIEQCIPLLRRGVRVGIRLLSRSSRERIVLTEGSLSRVKRLLDHYGFSRSITNVLRLNKSRDEFDRISQNFGRNAAKVYIIGDSLERDISPAHAASIRTVYFPGGFRPAKLPTGCDVAPDHTIDNFQTAAKIIDSETR